MSIKVTPSSETTGATIGAIVEDVDLKSDLSEEVFQEILNAWHKAGVLIFPGQDLDDDTQGVFSRRFGPLENATIFRRDGHGKIGGKDGAYSRISNIAGDGTVVAKDSSRHLLLQGNQRWHTDSSFKRVPAKASILSARVVPSEGGETEWADMRAAYDELTSEMQNWLSDKTAVHSYAYSQGLVGGTELVKDFKELPPVEHPMIRTHPITGRKSLYIGRHISHIKGEDVEKSRALVQRLISEACQPPRTYMHTWKAGDVVIWDNRCVLHRGHPWPHEQLRHMIRTTIAGDAPNNEWQLDTDVPHNKAA